MARSGTDRQDRQRHLVATSQGPQGEGHAPPAWALLGGFGLGSALLWRPRGLFPRGGVNLAGGSGEGVWPLQLELGSPAPCVGCTFPAAIHHASSFARPAPSQAFVPTRQPPQQHQSMVPQPPPSILHPPRAVGMQGSAHRLRTAASS